MSEYLQNLLNLTRTENMLKKALVLETLEEDLRLIQRMGYTKVDVAEAGIYKLILLHGRGARGEDLYMVLLSSYNNSVIAKDAQNYKNPTYSIKDIVMAKRALTPIFRNWIQRYGTLHIGSFNRENIETYRKLVEFLKSFTVGEITREQDATGSVGYDFTVSAQ